MTFPAPRHSSSCSPTWLSTSCPSRQHSQSLASLFSSPPAGIHKDSSVNNRFKTHHHLFRRIVSAPLDLILTQYRLIGSKEDRTYLETSPVQRMSTHRRR